MEVGFCPRCNKAGLLMGNPEHIPATDKDRGLRQQGSRWCPRCKEWVRPNYLEMMYRKVR